MFSTHGDTGQTIRGSNREGEELGAEFELVRRRLADEEKPKYEPKDEPRYAQAAAAYARALHPENPREPVRHAYQVMSRPVLTLDADDSVATAWRRFGERGVRQAPVLEPSQGVVGLVSERELLTVIDLVGKTPTGGLERPVREVMVSPVVCADPVTDIRRIARVLLDTGLSALPVVDEAGGLVGIVSRGDILRAVLADPPLSLWI